MACFYKLSSKKSSSFVLSERLRFLQSACWNSELQFIDASVVELELPDDYIAEWPDYIYTEGIPLVSDNLRDVFDGWKIDYLFYKKIIFKQSARGIKELYWLAVPMKIHCLDMKRSVYRNGKLGQPCINPVKTGRFEIFKLADCDWADVIVDGGLKERLQSLAEEGCLDGSLLFDKI